MNRKFALLLIAAVAAVLVVSLLKRNVRFPGAKNETRQVRAEATSAPSIAGTRGDATTEHKTATPESGAATLMPVSTPALPAPTPKYPSPPETVVNVALPETTPVTLGSGPAFHETNNVVASENMYIAHASLRSAEEADPMSETNRTVLTTMVVKALQRMNAKASTSPKP